MSNSALRIGRIQAVTVVLAQVLLGMAVATVALAGWGMRAAVSALAGAGIGIAATAFMAVAMLRHGPGVSAQRVTWSFFSGWIVKVTLTIALLVAALGSPGIAGLPLLAGYAATYIGYWIGAARWGAPRTDGHCGVAD